MKYTINGKTFDLEFIQKKLPSVSEIAKMHPMDAVLKENGAQLRSYGGPGVAVHYDPAGDGMIHITMNGRTATVQKDELIHVIRYARGQVKY